MKFIYTVVVLAICPNLFADMKMQWNPENRKKEANQVELWRANLEKSVTMQSIDKIEFLSLGLRNMAHRMGMNDHSPEIDSIYQDVQEVLLAIPGHAAYFVNEIEQAKAAAITPEELRARDGKISWSNYDRVRSAAFDTLERLPSIETVRALGEFLGDEENPNAVRPGDDTPDALGLGSNSALAIMALRTLIHDDPVKSGNDYLEQGETEAWQQWYEQIKSGNRTFRFEGDPTEYDLNGPAPKEKLVRIERDRKRDEERAAGHKKGPSVTESTSEAIVAARKPVFIAALVAGGALCAAAVWYFVRRQARPQ